MSDTSRGEGASAGGPSSVARASSGGAAGPLLPDYMEFTGVHPDLPGTPEGAQPAFFTYPADPKPFVDRAPMKNDHFTAATIINKVPAAHGGNEYWQAIEKRFGATFKLIGAPTKEFGAKLQTIIAGGDLPDMVQMYGLNQLPGILHAQFQDLTEYLSGDAVSDYPALANIPSLSWKSAVYGGALYGVPQHRTPQLYSLIVRDDIARQVGVGIEPQSGAELLQMCRDLTDTKRNHWASDAPTYMLHYVNEMLGTPNVWQVDGGKFIRDYETDQMKDALSTVRKMWSEGLFHPDSFASTSSLIVGWISSGAIRMVCGPGAFKASVMAVKTQDPSYSLTPITPPKWDGGGPAKQYLGPSMLAMTSLKKASAERIKGLLRVLNYLAAPFGTEEYNFLSNGIKGRDYTIEDGAPVATAKGKAEMFTVKYMMSPPIVHYMPGYPNETKREYEAEKGAVADGVPWPTAGLYSPTAETKGVSIDKKMTDLQSEIIRGRSVSEWDGAVSTWKKNGGDKIAQEYTEALANSSG